VARRNITEKERRYLDELIRGVYARRDIDPGYIFSSETFDQDFYLAIPLHKGQLSCREVINGEKLTTPISKDDQLTIDHIDGPYNENPSLRQLILDRGVVG
jgi:N-acetylneuraminate synthase